MLKKCAKCFQPNQPERTKCWSCGSEVLIPADQVIDPKALAAGAIMVAATETWTEDLPPKGVAYRATLAKQDVPGRDFDRAYLLRWGSDMVRGELTHGLAVATLANQYPYIYSKAQLGRA